MPQVYKKLQFFVASHANMNFLLIVVDLLIFHAFGGKAAEEENAAMIVGGSGLRSVELFGCPDESHGIQLPVLPNAIDDAAGVYLPDDGGKVLLTGGTGKNANKTWFFSFEAKNWQPGPDMNKPHFRHLMIYSEEKEAAIVLGGNANMSEIFDGEKWQEYLELDYFGNAICFQYDSSSGMVYIVTPEFELRRLDPLTGSNRLMKKSLPEEFHHAKDCTIAEFAYQQGLLLNTGSWFGLNDTKLHNSLEAPRHRSMRESKKMFTFNKKATIFGNMAMAVRDGIVRREEANEQVLQYNPTQDGWNNLGKLLVSRNSLDTVVEVPISHCSAFSMPSEPKTKLKNLEESETEDTDAVFVIGTFNKHVEVLGCDGSTSSISLEQLPDRLIWSGGAYDEASNSVLVCGGAEMADLDGDGQPETDVCYQYRPDLGTWGLNFPILNQPRTNHIMLNVFHANLSRNVPVVVAGNRRHIEFFDGQAWVMGRQWGTSFMLQINCVAFNEENGMLYIVLPRFLGGSDYFLYMVHPLTGITVSLWGVPYDVEDNPFCTIWNGELFFRDGYSMNLSSNYWTERQIAPMLNIRNNRNLKMIEFQGAPTIINNADCEEGLNDRRTCLNSRIDQYDPDLDMWSTVGYLNHHTASDIFTIKLPQKFCEALNVSMVSPSIDSTTENGHWTSQPTTTTTTTTTMTTTTTSTTTKSWNNATTNITPQALHGNFSYLFLLSIISVMLK